MILKNNNIIYEIDIHYGLRTISLTTYKEGAKDYIEHYKSYTMPQLLKELTFIKFGTPEYSCIQEIDAHIDSLKKIQALKQEIKNLEKQLKNGGGQNAK